MNPAPAPARDGSGDPSLARGLNPGGRAESLADLAEPRPRRELALSPALLAYDAFADELRVALRNGTGERASDEAGMGIEKIIGARWRRMSASEREAHVEKAREARRKMLSRADADGGGGGGETAGKKAKKKQKRAAEADADVAPDALALAPAKKKRGRGRPTKTAAAPAAAAAQLCVADAPPAGAPRPVTIAAPGALAAHPESSKQRERTRAKIVPNLTRVMTPTGPGETTPPGAENFVGRAVEGMVDGTFDAGFLLTARVDGALMRGIVWKEETTAVGKRGGKRRKARGGARRENAAAGGAAAGGDGDGA